MLTLCAEAGAGIRRHGLEAYPHECCGALIGRDRLVIEALALPNATAEGPRRRFLVQPADYRVAERMHRRDRLGTTSITRGRCSPT
jgi:hypothetical protein